MSQFKLVLGTHNEKKKRELVQLLRPHGFELLNLNDCPDALEVAETGESFADNARLKATVQAKHLHQWVLAEDSGLSVDALGGKPGVLSARFAGQQGDDQANNQLLLQRLHGVVTSERGAHYTCYVVIADPDGVVRHESAGRCFGRITTSPRGDAGFGYDPYFELVEYRQTFAELGDVVKSVLSHRARAMRAAAKALIQIRSA